MQRTYISAPNFDYPPGGSIAIGRILSNPLDPGTCINREGPLDFPDNMPRQSRQVSQYKYADPYTQSGLVGIWAKFLEFLGLTATASFSWSSSRGNVYEFKEMLTEFVDPTPEYLEKCIRDPLVKKYIEETGYNKSIYMITGVRIAIGATVAISRSCEKNGYVRVGVNGTSSGVPGSGGPEVKYRNDKGEELSFSSSSSFVFAYRLREFYYTKYGVRDEMFSKATLFSQDGAKSYSEQKVKEYIPKADTLLTESQTVESLGLEGEEVIDEEDGTKCAFVTGVVVPTTA